MSNVNFPNTNGQSGLGSQMSAITPSPAVGLSIISSPQNRNLALLPVTPSTRTYGPGMALAYNAGVIREAQGTDKVFGVILGNPLISVVESTNVADQPYQPSDEVVVAGSNEVIIMYAGGPITVGQSVVYLPSSQAGTGTGFGTVPYGQVLAVGDSNAPVGAIAFGVALDTVSTSGMLRIRLVQAPSV